MKRTSTIKAVYAAVIVGTCFAANTSFAATTSSTATTDTTSSIPVATSTQTRIVQNFQNGELSVQFRYEDGKLIGLRLLNVGKSPMQIMLLNETYVLGSNDYIALNPPKIENLHIFHAPYLTPLSTVDFLLPNRFSKYELYVLPTNLDSLTTK